MDPAPRVIIHVQSVARNGGRFITPISTPFAAPTMIPSTRQSNIASTTGRLLFLTRDPAIGSNKEAAALSGINVKFYHVMVYVVCGLFTGLAAIAYAAVTPTVQPGTGAGLEMDAIGGVFVGGVAATGGYGSVIGTLAGIFVIMLLKTGLPYIGLQANWQQIITGAVLIIAVLIDIMKEKKAAAK